MATIPKINWITEAEAAVMLGYKPKVLRRFCIGKEKKLAISTTKPNYKTVLYSKTDIENYLYENSNLIA